jgi:hypothetical protein
MMVAFQLEFRTDVIQEDEMRPRRAWAHDDEEGGWSTWSSGKDMGISIVVGDLLRILTDVPGCYRIFIRVQDYLQPPRC